MRNRCITGEEKSYKWENKLYIQSNRNKLLETILWTIETERETRWIKTTRKYMNVTNINFNYIRLNSKEYLKQFMIKWDRNIWEDELEMKTSLQLY